jgi:hypothetical protein
MHGLGETLLAQRRGWGSRRGSPKGGGGRRRGGGGVAGGRVASGGVSCSGDVVSRGIPELFSAGGAPWHGSTAALPTNSAQGKVLWELSEVRERVVGGKGGRGELGEGGHLLGASPGASVLSLALCSVREERQCSRA